jgi:large subunit ribosomal protein L19
MENTEKNESKKNTPVIEILRQENLRDNVPEGQKIEIGDTVQANVKIIEGDKERVQAFQGIVIAKGGVGIAETVTLRRVTHGQGVERIFPVHSPRIESFKIIRKGSVRRAKLYYIREAVGNAAKIKEKREKK